MNRMRLLPLSAALALLLAAPVRAESLLELYEAARAYDAGWQSAKAQYDASLHRAEQARAGILPSAGLSAGITRTDFENTAPPVDRNYTTQNATISAAQPLYRPANWVTWRQAQRQMQQARFVLEGAGQDLILRVSQAYFDVLAAQDTLAFVRAQKAAVAEQLASAKRNFEVGTSTITDTREAQARYDLVLAQEIAADNDLRVKRLALDTLVGRNNVQPNPLATPTTVPAPQPADPEAWVAQAETTSPSILLAKSAVEVAELETEKAKAGHKPTVDLTASYGVNRTPNGSATSGVASPSTCPCSPASPRRTASARRCRWRTRPGPTWRPPAAPCRRRCARRTSASFPARARCARWKPPRRRRRARSTPTGWATRSACASTSTCSTRRASCSRPSATSRRRATTCSWATCACGKPMAPCSRMT
jgi:outer membrane protein TolC